MHLNQMLPYSNLSAYSFVIKFLFYHRLNHFIMKPLFATILASVFGIVCFRLSAQTSILDSPTQKAGARHLFIDVHQLEPGKVKYEAVAEAHQKDLAVQSKYGVNFINYWVDEKDGTVICLSEAKDSTSIIQTHKEAHGLLPNVVMQVKQGQ